MLTIGKVARRVGIRPSAIRYYERQGMIRPTLRGANGYRIYTEDAVSLLNFVRRSQTLGITLREVKRLLELSAQGRRPCPQVKELARSHLHEVDLQIRELKLLRKQLRTLLHRKPGRSRGNELCPLIQD